MQYAIINDRLLASTVVSLTVRLPVCDAVHCGSRGHCKVFKVVPMYS